MTIIGISMIVIYRVITKAEPDLVVGDYFIRYGNDYNKGDLATILVTIPRLGDGDEMKSTINDGFGDGFFGYGGQRT